MGRHPLRSELLQGSVRWQITTSSSLNHLARAVDKSLGRAGVGLLISRLQFSLAATTMAKCNLP